MSHVATVEAQIKDLDALEQAVKNKGAQFARNQKQHQYYAGATKGCAHAIKVPGTSYEVGVVRKPEADEVYELAYDAFDGRIDKVFGSRLMGLKDEYQAVLAERFFDQNRMHYVREVDEHNAIVVRGIR